MVGQNSNRLIVKTVSGLLIFAVFMLLLSPFYVYRTVTVRLSYLTKTQTSLNIAGSKRNPVFHLPESDEFQLSRADELRNADLEVPAKNRVGCLNFYLAHLAGALKITQLEVICNGKKTYRVDLRKCTADPLNRQNVQLQADGIMIKPGKKIGVSFVLDSILRVGRRLDLLTAFYAVLVSLLPATLVFRKVETTITRGNAVSLIYSCAAVLFLAFPVYLIDYFETVTDENRNKAEFPDILEHQRVNLRFSSQFEDWLADRFTGRKAMMDAEVEIFSPSFSTGSAKQNSEAFTGRENWMFERNTKMFMNMDRFTDDELETCARNVAALCNEFEKRGIRLYFMLTPDKERVYSEYYPRKYKPVHTESRLDQLYRCLSGQTRAKIIFPLPELLKKKNAHLLYYKPGTHWTHRGACIASDMLLTEMKKDFPSLPLTPSNAEKWKKESRADIGLARILGYSDPMKQLPPEDLLYDCPVVQSPYTEDMREDAASRDFLVFEYAAKKPAPGSVRVLAITDSFWEAIVPFMFPASNRMLHLYFSNGCLFELYPFLAEIEKFHPDVCVIESTERFLARFLTITLQGD